MQEQSPIQAKVASKTYALTAVLALPILVLAIYLYPRPGQQNYALVFAAIGAFCFINVASIRFSFDGKTVRYSSLLKRTVIQMEEVVGAKIGYSESRGNNAFFFLSTRKRGDEMLNLPLFDKSVSQDFCHRLMEMGIVPDVADGMRARYLANMFYPNGWEDVEEVIEGE